MDSCSNVEVNFTRNVINIVVYFIICKVTVAIIPKNLNLQLINWLKFLKIDTIFSETHQFDRFTRNTHDLNVVIIDIYLKYAINNKWVWLVKYVMIFSSVMDFCNVRKRRKMHTIITRCEPMWKPFYNTFTV